MRSIIFMFVLLYACLFTLSCIKEKPCERQITVHSSDGNDSQIRDVGVYVYDEQGKLLGYHRTQAGTPISLEQYRPYGKIKVVTWGNAYNDPLSQSLSNPTVGSSVSDHALTQNLTGTSFAGVPLTHAPSDVFRGAVDIDFAQSGGTPVNTTILVDRVVSSYALSIRNVGAAFDGTNGDYKVLVRHPYSGVDFEGNLIGGESVYMPTMTYDSVRDQLTSSVEMALPTGLKGLVIEIYSGGVLVHTTSVDNSGNPIALQPNILKNILIDLLGSIDVILVASGWGEVVIFEGFD